MPDLVTHFFFAYIFTRTFRSSIRILFYVGAILPDVLTRPFYILFPRLYPYTVAVHTPIFMCFFVLFFAELFEQKIRHQARIFLFAGVFSHFFLDAFQKYMLGSGYLWLFPFSWRAGGLGVFWPHEPIKFVPVWIVVILLVEMGLYLYRKKKGSS